MYWGGIWLQRVLGWYLVAACTGVVFGCSVYWGGIGLQRVLGWYWVAACTGVVVVVVFRGWWWWWCFEGGRHAGNLEIALMQVGRGGGPEHGSWGCVRGVHRVLVVGGGADVGVARWQHVGNAGGGWGWRSCGWATGQGLRGV